MRRVGSVASKKFRLSAEEIRPIATGRGSCFASDRITVDGDRVGFMYREESDNDGDSGWRFLAGTESPEYMNDPENFALYDVNTIANYDGDIVAFLDAPVHAAFERNPSGSFVPVAFPGDED
jgi:hypothetical protein